jgi:hypothetical protein
VPHEMRGAFQSNVVGVAVRFADSQLRARAMEEAV